jgi:hypothetical protein
MCRSSTTGHSPTINEQVVGGKPECEAENYRIRLELCGSAAISPGAAVDELVIIPAGRSWQYYIPHNEWTFIELPFLARFNTGSISVLGTRQNEKNSFCTRHTL